MWSRTGPEDVPIDRLDCEAAVLEDYVQEEEQPLWSKVNGHVLAERYT